MRISCDVEFVVYSITGRAKPNRTRKIQSYLTLVKVNDNYLLKFPTLKNKNGNVFPLDPFPQIVLNRLQFGQLTFNFESRLQTTVMVSNANVEELKELMGQLKKIKNKEDVELKTHSEVVRKDFKPRSILISDNNIEKYNQIAASEFSDRTDSFIVEPIGMRIADKKWAKMKNLRLMLLNGNPFGESTKRLSAIYSMRNLAHLEMMNCSLSFLRNDYFTEVMANLPPTIEHLNLVNNDLPIFPKIFQLVNLKRLDLSGNKISRIPSRVACLTHLENFSITSNKLYSIPCAIVRLRLLEMHFAGNQPSFIGNSPGSRTMYRVKHPFGAEYSHPGGVDKLVTIAAHAVNTNPKIQEFAQNIVPREVAFEFLDFIRPDFSFSSVDLCWKCSKLTHIRTMALQRFERNRIANTTDSNHRFVHITVPLCIRCTNTDIRRFSFSENYFNTGEL